MRTPVFVGSNSALQPCRWIPADELCRRGEIAADFHDVIALIEQV